MTLSQMIDQIRRERERLATIEEWLDEVEAVEVASEAPEEMGELEGMFSPVATTVDEESRNPLGVPGRDVGLSPLSLLMAMRKMWRRRRMRGRMSRERRRRRRRLARKWRRIQRRMVRCPRRMWPRRIRWLSDWEVEYMHLRLLL
jgi:hypothetical protein